MVEEWYRILCDVCFHPHTWNPVEGDPFTNFPAEEPLKAAENDGWKVYRTARDHQYGKAWCPDCRDRA